MIDQINRTVTLNTPPKRIISLVPSQTELLVDLGLEDFIVGITKFCIHPKHLKKSKTIIGGTKNIKIDIIKELKPDIILCNKEENTKEIVQECEKIAPTHVSDIFSLEDSKELIKQYGTIFNKKNEALSLLDKLNFEIWSFSNFIKDKDYKKVAYFIWRKPWMVSGNNNFINHLLTLNKFSNIYVNKDRYPEVDITKIQEEGNPDLILLSSEPYPFKEQHAFEIQEHIQHAKILFVDGEMFSWYGSRLLKAFDYFKQLHNRI